MPSPLRDVPTYKDKFGHEVIDCPCDIPHYTPAGLDAKHGAAFDSILKDEARAELAIQVVHDVVLSMVACIELRHLSVIDGQLGDKFSNAELSALLDLIHSRDFVADLAETIYSGSE